SIFATPALAAIAAPQLGINYRGSALCDERDAFGNLSQVRDVVNGIDNNRQYGDGQKIACVGHLCAFFRNTGRTNS
ncbi:hypothetical protein L218DRAFT_842104, partial [Marasmius fiardii PR-910]